MVRRVLVAVDEHDDILSSIVSAAYERRTILRGLSREKIVFQVLEELSASSDVCLKIIDCPDQHELQTRLESCVATAGLLSVFGIRWRIREPGRRHKRTSGTVPEGLADSLTNGSGLEVTRSYGCV
jgi:hypothetical protein